MPEILGICPKDADMQVLLDQSISSKAIVLGSPNYYYDISGLMKNMIDRRIAWCYLRIGEHTGTVRNGTVGILSLTRLSVL